MKLISICMALCLTFSFNKLYAEEGSPFPGGDSRFYVRLGTYLMGYNEAKINISSPYLLGTTWISKTT